MFIATTSTRVCMWVLSHTVHLFPVCSWCLCTYQHETCMYWSNLLACAFEENPESSPVETSCDWECECEAFFDATWLFFAAKVSQELSYRSTDANGIRIRMKNVLGFCLCSFLWTFFMLIHFQRHPDGVASVKFKDVEFADLCVAALNGRWEQTRNN